MFQHIKEILLEIINLKDTTDIRKTIDSIRKSIAIRGYNVWILACAAMLASIGLDTNSEAVIIGAMLISPLMSPILGIGLSIGINDRDHLILALENFAIAVAASMTVSTIYFLITPFGEPTSQILARTHPTTLDVLIAIFGGIAGIVANSRKEITNAIPGVAIATALMPPLCVAGFGLANIGREGGLAILGGALYLFFINSFFIALSTFLIIRFLNFPYIEFVDRATKIKTQRWIAIFAVLVILPSGYFLFNQYKQFHRDNVVQKFINEHINNRGHKVVDFDYKDLDSLTQLNLYMTGSFISDDSVLLYDSMRREVNELKDLRIKFIQNLPPVEEDEITNRTKYEVLKDIQPFLQERQQQIDSLKKKITTIVTDTLPLKSLRKEIHINYPDIEKIAISEAWETDFDKYQDTITLVLASWKSGIRTSQRRQEEAKLGEWLKARMHLDTIKVVSY